MPLLALRLYARLARLPHDALTRGRAHAYWTGWVTLVSLAVYPTLNWLSSVRETRFRLYVPLELQIPFVPHFIWPYLSMYVVFLLPFFFVPSVAIARLGKQLIAGVLLAGVGFLLFPTSLGFVRTLPDGDLYKALYGGMYRLDLPHNLMPSLHVIYCGTILLACAEWTRPAIRALLWAWLAIIVMSTLLVHQHHVIDVALALVIVGLLRIAFSRDRKSSNDLGSD